MTLWYVRPSTSHSGTRNGTSYDTAWGTWSEIVWASLAAGDRLRICGAHVYTSSRATSAHGGTVNARVVLESYNADPGSITFTALGLTIDVNHTEIRGLTITSGTAQAILLNAANLQNVAIVNNNLVCGAGSTSNILGLRDVTGLNYSDILIDGNTFTGKPSAGSAIRWWLSTTGDLGTISRLTISNNKFVGVVTSRAVIRLLYNPDVNAGTKLADIKVIGNTFTDCVGLAIEVGGGGGGALAVPGRDTGIIVRGNVARRLSYAGAFGGMIFLYQFGPSLTPGFGPNLVEWNEGYEIQGAGGFIDLLQGTYVVQFNYCDDVWSNGFDGNGVLLDLSSYNCVVRWNVLKNLRSNGSVYGSGMGIYVISSTGAEVYGNLIENCRIGLGFFCPTGSTQSANVYGNTFANCSVSAIYHGQQDTNKTGTHCRNNVFVAATSGVQGVNNTGAVWSGTEDYNNFYNFGANVNHTFGVNTQTQKPNLSIHWRPAQNSPLRRAGTHLAYTTDCDGFTRWNPPTIGAFEIQPDRSVR